MNTVRETVDAYLDWNQGVRSMNWNRDNGYVLRRWALDMHVSQNCEALSEITTPILQAWFSQKLRTLKIQTAAAYLKSGRAKSLWGGHDASAA